MESTAKTKYDLSILIPFLNEEDNLQENYQQIKAVLDDNKLNAEIIYVDDGSKDKGTSIIRNIAKTDPRVKLISFFKNFGQTAAMSAAFKLASGKTFISLDADNQNDPRDIPALLKKMDEGFEVVSGWRKHRQDGFFLRTLPSRIANWLISRVTGVYLKDYGCTLKAYNAEYLEQVRLYGEMHRFIPAYAKFAGARVTEMEVNHRARTKGTSKYGIGRTFKVVLDLLTVKFLGDYSSKPIYFFGGLGFGFAMISFAITFIVAYQKFILGVWVHKNPLFLLAVLIFMLGVILVMMGLIAELLSRTYYESQNKEPYRIKETVNF